MAKGEDHLQIEDYRAFVPPEPTLFYSAELHEARESHMGHVLFTWSAKIRFEITLHRLLINSSNRVLYVNSHMCPIHKWPSFLVPCLLGIKWYFQTAVSMTSSKSNRKRKFALNTGRNDCFVWYSIQGEKCKLQASSKLLWCILEFSVQVSTCLPESETTSITFTVRNL